MVEKIINTTLELGTELSALKDLEAGLEWFQEKAQISQRDHFQIRLVLDELVTNSVSYGFTGGVGSGITIDIALLPDNYCEIVYIDDAPRFNPLEQTVRPRTSSSEAPNFGGFGIALVKNMMNELSYSYENGRNIIKMKKKLDTDDE